MSATLPERVLRVEPELRRLAGVIREGLAEPRAPGGAPVQPLGPVVHAAWERVRAGVEDLGSAFRDVFPVEEDPLAWPLSEARQEEALRRLESAVASLLREQGEIWRRPFPAGWEAGQSLLSAVSEKALRQLLLCFEVIFWCVEHPEEALARKGGGPLRLVLSPVDRDSAEALRVWLKLLGSWPGPPL